MADLQALLQQGNAWLFIPSAVVLGVLHGLEPGHSKTMMAAFIIAVRGTLGQAVLLGLAATVSHTAIVWLIALSGLYFGHHWSAQASEPYLQMVSAAMMVGVAAWMLWRTFHQRPGCFHADHGGVRDHGHDHSHPGDGRLECRGGDAVVVEVVDEHERAHAEAIARRFTNRRVTTAQIVIFGLTGGLIPCPASITVLLLCLQLKKVALGATLVLGFSLGLAVTMVSAGALAALSLRHVSKRWSGFGTFARRAPYVSGALILLVGLFLGYQGISGLRA